MRLGAPTGASYQILQTRAKLTAHLLFQIVGAVVLLWVAFTGWVVWHETAAQLPTLGQQYWWRWMIGGIITALPLLNLLASILRFPVTPGAPWYPLPQLMDWLNGPQMYTASFGTWFIHYAWRTALAPLGIGIFGIIWRARHRTDSEHLRGLRLLTPREHNHQLNGGSVVRFFKGSDEGIRLGSTTIPRQLECEHFLITGSPGSGKSTLIRHMLSQIEERGQTAIVVDPEGEYCMEFYKPERGDVLLNPIDARCPFWSPWLEFRDESFTTDAEALSASLIRGQAHTATEIFFQDSARTLIEAAFQVTRDRTSPTSIAELLSKPREDLHNALAGTRAYALVDPRSSETGAGIVATASNAIKPFFNLPTRDQADTAWSAREWAQERKGFIFFPSTEDARAATRRLQGMWLDVLIRWLMSADIGSEQIWIICDELPVLEYQTELTTLLTRGRKRGLACTIAFQNISQLRSIYGRDTAITLTSCPTTQVFLRITEAETAKWASEQLGSRDLERMSVTQLAGVSQYREGINLSNQRVHENIVSPGEIQLLKPFCGYISVAGHDRCQLKFPERHLVKNHSAFIPRSPTAPPAADKRSYDAC